MNYTALLVSRNQTLLLTRELILQRAGYTTACAFDSKQAVRLTAELRPKILIIGHTFTDHEQNEIIDRVFETNGSVAVLALRTRFIPPKLLLDECARLLHRQPGSTRLRIVEREDASHRTAAINKRPGLEIAS